MKRQPQKLAEWEKIFASLFPQITKIYKEPVQLNKKKSQSDLKIGRGSE